MEVSMQKTGFRCYHTLFSQKIKKEESQEMVVPDTMPDIGEILDANGTFVIRSKEASAEGVRITGNIHAQVLYQSEESKELCALEMSVPVELKYDAELPEDDVECAAQIRLLSLEARALNPRKVVLKTEILAMIDCYQETVKEFASALAEGEAGIYIRRQNAVIAPMTAVKEKTFVVTDELMLPAAYPAIKEFMRKEFRVQVEDVKPLGSKLMFKGCVISTVLYRSVDGLPVSSSFSSNFSQIMECDVEFSNAAAWVSVLPTGLYWELPEDSDGRTIRLEAHLLAQARAYESKEIAYVADAYSNLYPLQLQQQDCVLPGKSEYIHVAENFREHCETPIAINQVVCSRVGYGECEVLCDGIEVPICTYLICKTENGDFCLLKKKCRIKFLYEQCKEHKLRDFVVDLRELQTVCTGNGIDIRLFAELHFCCIEESKHEMICELDRGEEMKDTSVLPSLVLMKATERSDLWMLAKENCSSSDLIQELNAIRDVSEPWEKFILIPKCN